MKKTLLFILAIVVCFTLAGCKSKKVETETLTKEINSWKLSVDVPKDNGYKFVEEIKDDYEYAPTSQTIILSGDKVRVYFERNSSYSGEDNFKDFVKARGENEEIIDFNGRDAIKTDYRYGDGKGDLKGYQYLVSMDDISGYMAITVLPSKKDGDIKKLMDDSSVKVIIDSIKIEK